MITVTLYSRQDCHLCDQAREDLEALQQVIPHQLVMIDVDSSPGLQRKYSLEVPVIVAGPYRLKAPITRQDILVMLGAAQDRQQNIEALENPDLPGLSRTWSKADGFTYWFSKHYVGIFNLFVMFYLGLPVLAPILMKAGIETPARLIYRSYSLVCHQLAFRSFFLFGEQYAYPRSAAGVTELQTYSQATGFLEDNTAEGLWAAREFYGNERLGYKIALCERDVAIYGGILLFGLVFSISGRRLPAIPWYIWILIGIAPIGFDGLSQLLSQPPLGFIPYRESTPWLRTLTGGLFGAVTAWFGYPMVEETMSETRKIMTAKLKRVRKGEDRMAQSNPSAD